MTKITSTRNPTIKWIRTLQSQGSRRRDEGLFIIEGVRLVEESAAERWPTRLVIHTDDQKERGQVLLEELTRQGVEVQPVAEHVMQAASDTQTPQGILAVLEMHSLPLPERIDFALIADGIRDPGNLGTMLRTACAAGVDAVLLPPGNSDPYSPKVLRGAMGAHFRLPIHSLPWEEIEALLGKSGARRYLADPGGGLPYYQADFRAPLALVIGGEAAGASEKAMKHIDTSVHIPMPGEIESLNAAAAAAILLFEVRRQRAQTE